MYFVFVSLALPDEVAATGNDGVERLVISSRSPIINLSWEILARLKPAGECRRREPIIYFWLIVNNPA